MTRPHRSSEDAFTLIELLVVVSIIAVLAALLIPVIGMVRSQAKNVECQNNLRQVAMATNAYADDYDGAYPHASGDGIVATKEDWRERLSPYIADGKNKNRLKDTGNVLWTCGVQNERGKPFYGMNERLDLPASAASGYFHQNMTSRQIFYVHSVRYSSARVLFGDSNNVYLDAKGTPYEWWPTESDPTRHGDTANYVFCDFHVESLKPDEAWKAIRRPDEYIGEL